MAFDRKITLSIGSDTPTEPRQTRVKTSFLGSLDALRRILLPDLCLGCDTLVAKRGVLCAECWPQVAFIEKPYCAVSGVPFAYDHGDNAISAQAIANPPAYDRARAATAHDALSARLVRRLKYADRTDLAPWMAQWMKRAGDEQLEVCDVIVPVPLHRTRYWSRRYNQSAELARNLADLAQKPFNPSALRRKRTTQTQIGLTPAQRAKNVSGAFEVPDDQKIEVTGRNILLIDDVYTTGSTVEACCRALKRAKAARIDVLTFSRALR